MLGFLFAALRPAFVGALGWLRPAAPHLMAIGGAGVVIVAAYQMGQTAERQRGEAAALRSQLAVTRIDLALNRSIAAAAERDADLAAQRRARDADAIRDYQLRLDQRAACRADQRDVDLDRRLRRDP